MKKLDVYIIKQIVTGFLLVALSLMAMLWLTQSLRFVEMVTDKGLPVYLFVEMTSLLMPRVFSILSPIALFVAVMFVYNRLITDSELVVMKAVGISSVVIARAAIVVGMVLALFNVFVLNIGIPTAEAKFRDLEYEVKNSFSKMMLREGAFTSFKNNMTIFIDKFLDDGTAVGILVNDGKNPQEKVVTVAERGTLEYTGEGPKILLKKGTRQVMNKKSGQFSSMTFDDYVVDFGDVSVARKKAKSVRERSIAELFAEADKPGVSEKDALSFKAEAHRRLLAPWFNLVFALLACTGLLIANFNRRESGENPSSAASPALPVIQTGDGGEQPRAQIGFALPGDQGELQSGGAAGEPAPSAREDSCRLQVLAATAVGLFCLVTLLVLRAAALKRPDLLASDAATATVAQFRDFVSGCVGFLIGCPTGKSGSTGS